MSNSWVLLRSGTVLINSLVTPVEKGVEPNDLISHMVTVLMSKFVVSLLPEEEGSPINIWSFGEVARGIAGNIKGVLKNRKLSYNVFKCPNPAYVFRNSNEVDFGTYGVYTSRKSFEMFTKTASNPCTKSS